MLQVNTAKNAKVPLQLVRADARVNSSLENWSYHGTHNKLKALTVEVLDGTSITGIDEKEWVRVYLEKRRDWLRESSLAPVRQAAYRPDELLQLVQTGNWTLDSPLVVRRKRIA
jgi:hypothetical protein